MNKKLTFLFLCISLLLSSCRQERDPRIEAAYRLIERVTPGYGDQFQLELMEPVDGQDAYEIDSEGGKVVLRGNNTVSLATAFNQYLKYTCQAHVSWFGDQLDLPEKPCWIGCIPSSNWRSIICFPKIICLSIHDLGSGPP